MRNRIIRKLNLAVILLAVSTGVFASKIASANCISGVQTSSSTNNFPKRNDLNRNFDADEDEIFILVNDERQRNNLHALVWDTQLSDIARAYSKQMADEDFFDHFDSQGADVVVRAKKSNLKHWSKIGENLFSVEHLRNFDAFAVNNWMKSPTHRQNILDADFNTAGIGIAESASGEVFITQIFIRR